VRGKTIKSINKKAVNSWTIVFTDGSKYRLFAEDAVYTPHGNIPGLFVRRLKPKKKP